LKQQQWIAQAMRTHERPLMRYATRLLGNVESARDVVQDSFLKLCKQSPEELDGHLRAWLFTVCRNRAFDLLRRKDGQMGTLQEHEPAVEQIDTVAAQEESGLVRDQIAALPDRQQEVLRLKFQEGLSYREIAAITDVSVSNVGFLLHTALKTLRGRLGGEVAPASGRNQS